MALKDTTNHMRDLLVQIVQDLEKAEGGNKAASQRVRTGTVRLEKVAKIYRKESISSEKSPRSAKKSARKPAARASAAPQRAPARSSAPASRGPAPKAKPKAKAQTARPRGLSMKRPTAKLPSRASIR